MYVDDIIIIRDDEEKIKWMKHYLAKEFEIKDFDIPSIFLGWKLQSQVKEFLLHKENIHLKFLKNWNA